MTTTKNIDCRYDNHKEQTVDMTTTKNTDCIYDNHNEHGL